LFFVDSILTPCFLAAVGNHRARWDLPLRRLPDVGESRALGPSDQFQDLGALTLGAETAGMATPGLAAWLLALASFFGAGIFYCQVACEKIPGLSPIPMEWWEETKPVANRFDPT
jgi:hypothetical protein